VKILKEHPLTKKYVVPLIHLLGMQALEAAAGKPTWKTVWCAGQSVGLVHEILSCREIVDKMVTEYHAAVRSLPRS
jgi:nitronate monooxygenase